jgi:hypothetical protein
MYFFDESYSYEELLKLINHNQRLWGGRYNPIIPFKNGKIMDGYYDIIKNYDPDYIFYTRKIDLKELEKLRLFNPKSYINLEKESIGEILGISAFYFVSQFDIKSNILMPEALWKAKTPLLDFYETNFGLTANGIVSDYGITKGLNQIKITPENLSSLNQIIHEKKPIFSSHLSKRNLNTKILRSLRDAHHDSCEIVIAKDKNCIDDLLYFWNRQLFECHGLLFVTVDEIQLLCEDKFFGGVLYDLSNKQAIDIVSFSLTQEEIENIIKNLLVKIAFHRRFQYKKIYKFPFTITDDHGLFERDFGEKISIQTLLGDNNLLFLPDLSFTNNVGFHPQRWAIDMQIRKIGMTGDKPLGYPLTTNTMQIIKRVEGRINRMRTISFFIDNYGNTSGTVEVETLEFQNILQQLITSPIFQGEELKTKFVEIGLHDSSNRLNSFIKMFNSDFESLNEFFRDKFWVKILEGLCTSQKSAGDSISFNELLIKCKNTIEENVGALKTKEESYRNEENLAFGLKDILACLCQSNIFLQGFKFKCPVCSSIFWYHIKEVHSLINCKGCLKDFTIPIEPYFSYKLNDLVKNNIFQSKTQRDGNLTVARTLATLSSRHAHYSFDYSPQLNLFSSSHTKKPDNEIDIIALADGRLIIGEAKHESREFRANSHKSLNSLIEVSKQIYPDKVILSCYNDEHSFLENAIKYLERHFSGWEYAPEIESMLLSKPNYFDLKGRKYFFY